jgi:hypothetical protein
MAERREKGEIKHLSLFDEEEESVEIQCPHCGAIFILSPKMARDFEEVYVCYVMIRENLTMEEFIQRWMGGK